MPRSMTGETSPNNSLPAANATQTNTLVVFAHGVGDDGIMGWVGGTKVLVRLGKEHSYRKEGKCKNAKN